MPKEDKHRIEDGGADAISPLDGVEDVTVITQSARKEEAPAPGAPPQAGNPSIVHSLGPYPGTQVVLAGLHLAGQEPLLKAARVQAGHEPGRMLSRPAHVEAGDYAQNP